MMVQSLKLKKNINDKEWDRASRIEIKFSLIENKERKMVSWKMFYNKILIDWICKILGKNSDDACMHASWWLLEG